MDITLQNKCDAFLHNYDVFSRQDKVHSQDLILAAAGYYMSMELQPDFEHLQYCGRIMRQKEGLFSDMNGFTVYIIRGKMAAQNDPEEYLDCICSVYKKIHPSIVGDDQAVLEAMTIVDFSSPDEYEEMIRKTTEIYNEMKKTHVWLTSENDKPFAALMAVLGTNAKTTHDKAEYAYRKLKDRFTADKDTIQTLSHILSVSVSDPDENCRKVCFIDNALRRAGIRFGGSRRASILGTLVDLHVSPGDLCAQIIEADSYLKKSEPFAGAFGTDEKTRHLFAVQCVNSVHFTPERPSVSAAVSSAIELNVMLEIMMSLILATSLNTFE